jgi:cell division protein FtsB
MRKFSESIVIKAVVVLFSIFCIVTIIKLQFENNEIQNEIGNYSENNEVSGLKAELEEKQKQVEELEKELDKPVDEDYIIRVARERLGLRLPPEIIFYNGD